MSSNDENKTKRILCFNAIKGRICNYGSKCMYAHNLSEQKVDPIRHKVYTILKNDNSLKNINLIKDRKLFTTFVQLTKVCYHCSKNECHGGYNCRNGTVNPKYKICYDDLMYGNCRRLKCHGLHLSTRGLVPYYTQMNMKKDNNPSHIDEDFDNNIIGENEYNNSDEYDNQSEYNSNELNESEESNESDDSNELDETIESEEDEFNELNNTNAITKPEIIENKPSGQQKLKFITSSRTLNRNLQGVLVTENFLIDYYNKKKKSSNNNDSEESYETITKMKEFLSDEHNDDSLDESIFKV